MPDQADNDREFRSLLGDWNGQPPRLGDEDGESAASGDSQRLRNGGGGYLYRNGNLLMVDDGCGEARIVGIVSERTHNAAAKQQKAPLGVTIGLGVLGWAAMFAAIGVAALSFGWMTSQF